MAKYTKTYWHGKGKYEKLVKKLEKLIPDMGPVDKPHKNKALERYRKAANAYYDYYNNALINRARSFSRIFGVRISDYWTRGLPISMLYNENLMKKVEQRMDEIILEAAKEQGLV